MQSKGNVGIQRNKRKVERYLIGIKYLELNEKLEDQIIEYVFERQRELIQKGVL